MLKEVAATLAEQLEPGMVLGRYGGEEFAILLPDCAELAQAKRVAERLRVAVEARLVKSPTSDELLEVTVSIGLTLALRGEGVEDLLNRADECLYMAKMAGRNCVVGSRVASRHSLPPYRQMPPEGGILLERGWGLSPAGTCRRAAGPAA